MPANPPPLDAAARRDVVTEFARVAHHLLNDIGYTRQMAARDLARCAVKYNGTAWDESALTTLLGDAASLVGRSHVSS